jgi:hypothetical protein
MLKSNSGNSEQVFAGKIIRANSMAESCLVEWNGNCPTQRERN